MTKRQISFTGALVAILLTLSACGSQTVLTLGLDAIETFAQELVQDYAPNSPQAQTAATELTAFVAYVHKQLSSGEVTSVELTNIGAEGAALIKAGIPAGTSSVIAGVIQLGLNAVSAYLQGIEAAKTTAALVMPRLAQSFAAGAKVKLSGKDKKALADIKAKNDALEAKLAALAKK